MRILDMAQGSPEWHEMRLGCPSATLVSEIVTQDGKPSASRVKLLYRLAGEILSGERIETYQNAAMARGTDMEPEARAAYEIITDSDVQSVGFVLAESPHKWGCSPDGLVGDDGLLEIKCPMPTTQVEYLVKGKLPGAYWHQVHAQITVTERAWCDFFSYHPAMRPFLVRVHRDEQICAMIKNAVESFCEELQALVSKL